MGSNLFTRCFLRSRDIHGIDEQHIRIEKGVLNLVLVAPIEKRGGSPIEKPFQINPDADIMLLSVNELIFCKENEHIIPA
ncbi:hypothetical protein AYI69_g3201 [Smittium culicis]|uniref:Uncharacterized protein n=1 Tax=Smittium culicis TaxID=133412 RepID=A0A1R1YKG3_9FUNG|nr:hypothetical protein AYI69_g3201 [Smittium culicis]